MRPSLYPCVVAVLVVGSATASGAPRNPFIPRTWPRVSPPSTVKSMACGYGPTAFLAAERSDAVARVEIVAMRGSHLDLKIIDQLKGTTPAQLYAYGGGNCRDRLKVGTRVVVMTSRGSYLASGESVLLDSDARAATLAALLAAPGDDVRAKVASDAVASTDDALSDEAQRYLLTSPTVLNAIGMRPRRTLYLAAKRRPTRDLVLVLSRIRLRIPALVYADLGLKDSVAHRIASVLDFEAETDPDRLADAIQREPDPVRQYAAFERCDRLRKSSSTLEPARWLGGSITRRMATAVQLEAWCRGQTPARPPYVYHPRPPLPPPRPPAPAPRKPAPKRLSACDPFAVGCRAPIPLKAVRSTDLLDDPFDRPAAKPKPKAKRPTQRKPKTPSGSPYETDLMDPFDR